MIKVSKDTWAVFKGFLEGKDKEIIESAENRKLSVKMTKDSKNPFFNSKYFDINHPHPHHRHVKPPLLPPQLPPLPLNRRS